MFQFGNYGSYFYPNLNNMGYGNNNNNMQFNNPIQPMQQPSPQQQPIFAYVNGVEGAKAYMVPAGMTAILRDSDNANIFYTKIANGQGQATLRAFRYEELTNAPAKSNSTEFVSRQEFEEFKKSLKVGGSNVQSDNANVAGDAPRK